MMKKLSLVAIILVITFMLAGCDYLAGSISIENIQFNGPDGSGTRSYLLIIPKNGAQVPLSDPPKYVEGRDEYLPNGIQGIVDKLQAECKLEDAEIFWVDFSDPKYQGYNTAPFTKDEIDVVVLQFKFDSIAELNEKTRILADGREIGDATLITNKFRRAKYTEPGTNYRNSIQWAWDALYSDPEVFNYSHDPGMAQNAMCFLFDTKINFSSGSVGAGVDKDISALGFILNPPPAEPVQ